MFNRKGYARKDLQDTWLAACSFEQHRISFVIKDVITTVLEAGGYGSENTAATLSVLLDWLEEDGITPMESASEVLQILEACTTPDFTALLKD